MAFARTDTSILNHRKFVGIEPSAGWLWALGNAYCWDQLTDGFIPLDQVPRLMTWIPKRRVLAWAEHLVRRQLWHVVRSPERTPEHDAARQGDDASLMAESEHQNSRFIPGFRVHDWLDHNPSKARVLTERQAAQDRMKQRRASSRSPERTGARSPERTGERTGEQAPHSGARSGVRSRQDVDVDVQQKQNPPTPLVDSHGNGTPVKPAWGEPYHPAGWVDPHDSLDLNIPD